MTTSPSFRRRRARSLAVVGPAVVLVVVTTIFLAGCTTSPSEPPASSSQGNLMRNTTDTAAPDLVQWDFSSGPVARELGGLSADVVSAETLGRNGVDVQITLPGGDTVTGAFGLVTGDSGGGGGPVRYLSLATTHLHDGGWDTYIDAFVEQFGGDREAITAYLDSALAAIDAGRVDPGRHFPGDARPDYEPTLQIRPSADGVVVAWKFTLNP